MLWGGGAAAIVVLLVGIVAVTRDNSTPPSDGAVLPDTTVSAPSSDLATTVATGLPTTIATTLPATTLPATTLPATTLPVTTLPPETTVAPGPAVPVVPAGWSPAELIPQAIIPPFDANWQGTPSPVIVDPAAGLPDGVYAAQYVSRDAATVTLDISRFDSCQTISDGCAEGPYTDTDLGIASVSEGLVTLPLDSSIGVVLNGWSCEDVISRGNGADLGEMYAAIDVDYELAFGAGLASGTDPQVLIAAARADPALAFGPLAPECDSEFNVSWQYGAAPPVLVQRPFDPDTFGPVDPATLFGPTVVEVSAANTTLYLYAGFFS